MMRLIGLYLFIIGLVICITYAFHDFLQVPENLESQQLERLLKNDLHKLETAHQLPASWYEVNYLELRPLSKEAASWLRGMHIPIEYKPGGNFLLHMTVDSSAKEARDNGDKFAVVEFHMVDLRTKNSVWEFGRTYTLKKDLVKDLTVSWIVAMKSIFTAQIPAPAPTSAAKNPKQSPSQSKSK